MATVDLRTRFDGDALALDPQTIRDALLPACLEVNGIEAGHYATNLGLDSLTFDAAGERFTLAVNKARLVLAGESSDSLVVSLDMVALSDLVQDVVSTFGVQMTGRAQVVSGSLANFIEWEPVLRCLLDGRPAYVPGSVAFRDREGGALDVRRSFTLNDSPDEIGHFLAEAGFLHLQGVFTAAEMAAVSSELDEAIAGAKPDDGASWWARTEAGESYPARILGFNQKSPTLRSLLHSDRFRSVGTFTDDVFVQRDPDVGDSAEGLLKKVGVIEGISDVSWHKDCSMGGHSRHCCGLIVGISVTGANATSGELGVVPGSHRANIAPLGVEGLDLARIPLPTHAGDLTVHCSCTLHMSRPPVSAERRVVYTGFGLAKRPEDRRIALDAAQVRKGRAALNGMVRGQTQASDSGARIGSFEL